MNPASSGSRSIFLRLFEPLAASLWALFILWTLLIAVVWSTGFGEAELAAAVSNQGLRGGLGILLGILDPVWFTLAAVNVYAATAAREGLSVTRRWALVIFVTALLVSGCSALTGWPLGSIAYTSRLGPKIGPVPLGLPMLWLAVILGARALAERLFARASHLQLAGITGLFAMLTALNIDPLSWRVRSHWLWSPNLRQAVSAPPVQNFATWFLVAASLAYALRSVSVVTGAQEAPARAWTTFCLINATCVLIHLVRLAQ